MKQTACWTKLALLTAVAVILFGFTSKARAADLPLAAASPLTGVAFDDRPLLLPVQRNFQMAMLTAGSELGRSCGRMEAYGWRMSQTEQGRVNQIFNNTVDRLRLLGYTIETEDLTSVSKDITLFTADHNDRHFMFLWSAGELGLVLNLCETSAPSSRATRPAAALSPSVQTFPVSMEVLPARLDPASKYGARDIRNFSPVGKWVGGYSCAQGYTGGTLEIGHLRGQNFDGVFKFYPTTKNLEVPPGSYTVNGQYDKDSKRILINPGKWIKRPPNFYNTVIVGNFDAVTDTFSAYFQGISGCTSFEAKRIDEPSLYAHEVRSKAKRIKHKAKKKKVTATPVAMPMSTSDAIMGSPAPASIAPALVPALVPASPPTVTQAPPPPMKMPVVATPVLQGAPPTEPPGVPPTDQGGILLAAPASGPK